MFIVFEGIDGCGKTTQIFKLSEHIYSLGKYFHILITREAYKDRKIREFLKQIESKDKAEMLTIIIIDGNKSIEEIFEEIKKCFLECSNNI